ncbi:MAG: hypothetical protein ACLSHU_15120 [Oscillospiraceae bacterium]
MKRIVTLQDISCLGRCSVTVALPVISAMGVECVALPTAVLSTHTMFPDFTCLDLTDQIAPIARHWKAQSIHFDAIYTGYLASPDQCDRVIEFFQDFRTPDGLIFVDPAMADGVSSMPPSARISPRPWLGFAPRLISWSQISQRPAFSPAPPMIPPPAHSI